MSEADVDEGRVPVGGTALFVRIMGQGMPPVVFDPGLGDTADEWAHVQRAAAEFTSAIAYDRAGLGHSASPTERELPRTSERMVVELRALLDGAGVPGPYVLVGHSLGGLNVQLFAARYPAEVAGMVLVDAAFAEQGEWIERVIPPDLREGQRQMQAGENVEHVNFDASFAEARAADWRTSAPLIVLSRGIIPPEEHSEHWTPEHEVIESWWPYQRALATHSPRGLFRVAERSGHNIQVSQPDLIITAIREVVEAARQG